MRKLKFVLFVFIVLLSFNTQAQNETKIDDAKMQDFIKKMCSAALTFRTLSTDKAGSNMENLILTFIGVSKEDPNYKEKLTKFWNENNHRFICHEEGSTEDTRNPQHFLKRIVDLGMYRTVGYDFLLSDEDEYPIDVNTVEIYNGKEETLLDYINNQLKDHKVALKYNVKEIKELRNVLILDYGAKTASELKK